MTRLSVLPLVATLAALVSLASPGRGQSALTPLPELRLEAGEIETALAALAERAGELGDLRTLGASRAGRSIQVLALTRPTEEPADDKPALLFAGFDARAYDAEATLAFGQLLVRAAGEEPFASLLADHVVLLAPALDPDARAEGGGGRTDFDLNFPLGWRPASLRPGAGDLPLSEPEALLAAELLEGTRNLALVVGVTPEGWMGSDVWAGAELPAGDRAVLEELGSAVPSSSRLSLVPWSGLGSPGGGFLDYAYQALGVFPVAWSGPPEPVTPDGLTAWSEEVAVRTAELLFSLPRVRIEKDALVELAPGLWQLDVEVRNGGTIPTLSALAVRRLISGELRLTLSGARLVATARRHAPEGAFQLTGTHAGVDRFALEGGILGGGETRWLRLVLEAEQGSALSLRGASARAGSAQLEILLTDS